MANKSPKVQIQFINQALSQAQVNLAQAKTLMRELEESLAAVLPSSRDLPGIIGKFDGIYLVTDDGKKFQVPENYAGKSKLVYGDTLKMIEDVSGGPSTFKQIERVPRTTLTGVLVKKDGKLVAVTADGSHSLLPAAVSFHHGVEGDEVKVIVPEEARNCSFAALDAVPGRDLPVVEIKPPEEKKPEEPKKEMVKKEVKAAPKKEQKEQKEQVSSITVEPEVVPAPKITPKKTPDLPRVLPAAAPKATPMPSAPAPAAGTVNSILGDDDLR